MAKRRSIQEDTAALKTKAKESATQSDNPEGSPAVRSLRKRLKRAQRKIRMAKIQEERLKPKATKTES